MDAPAETILKTLDQAFAGMKRARETFEAPFKSHEIGTIATVSTGIVTVTGLPGVEFEELIRFPGDLFGIAFNVDEKEVGVVLLGNYSHLHAGDEVERTGRVMDVAVGDELIGRVIDPIGRPLDGKPPITTAKRLPIERNAKAIMDRAPVTAPLQTGIKVIDAVIPIGRGQRELILGDRQTGKTAIAINTILNQHDQNVVCVYCAIGQRASSVAKAVAELRERGAMDYTLVVVSEGNDAPGLNFIAPYAATSIAEHFMENGRDVLIIYDDLTQHARAYRELSLLLRRPPGREAFPATYFTFIRACWNEPPISGRSSAAAHSRLCPSSKPMRRTFPPIFPPTSFPSPTGSFTFHPRCLNSEFCPPWMWPSPFRASAAKRRSPLTTPSPATSSSPIRSLRNWRLFPVSAPSWMRTRARSLIMASASAPASSNLNLNGFPFWNKSPFCWP